MERSQPLESAGLASSLGPGPYKVCDLWHVVLSKCLIFKMKILIIFASQYYNERYNNIYNSALQIVHFMLVIIMLLTFMCEFERICISKEDWERKPPMKLFCNPAVSKVVYAYPRESRKNVLTLWSLLNENKNLSRVQSNQCTGCHRKGVGFAE